MEQIIRILREAEIHLSQSESIKLVSLELGITEQAHIRWRKEYGGMKVSQARRLKAVEQENTRLKRAVAQTEDTDETRLLPATVITSAGAL